MRHGTAHHESQRRLASRSSPEGSASSSHGVNGSWMRPSQRKSLRPSDLALRAVNAFDRLADIVDKHPLARRVRLQHHWPPPTLPSAVQLAPAAVAIAASLVGSILFPL